jgi:hypothetical protein
LEKLPLISEAFERGELSYSKVRAMTRVATPENESTLLTIALHGTATHVEKLVRKCRWLQRQYDAERTQAQHRERYLHTYWDDGALVIQAKLPREVGQLVRKALEAAMAVVEKASDETEAGAPAENETRSNVSAGTSVAANGADVPPVTVTEKLEEPLAARRADALVLMAKHFLASDSISTGSTGDRYQVVVHIDQSLLSDPPSANASVSEAGAARPHCSEYDDGRALAVDTARRLGCDGSLVGIVEDQDGEPLNVGRKTRAIPPAIRRALKARDGGCRFPGCTYTRFTEGHHVKHWADGGETKLSNLITLCSFHHRLVHEGGYGLRVTDDGLFVFSEPDGTRLAEAGRLDRHLQKCFSGNISTDEPATLPLFRINREHGLEIDRNTAMSRWIGDRMDYGWTTEILCRDDSAGPRAAGEERPPGR